MILVRVTVIGEEGTSPFSQVFEYSNESFDNIFAPTVDRIKEKLKQRLRINLYECLAYQSQSLAGLQHQSLCFFLPALDLGVISLHC